MALKTGTLPGSNFPPVGKKAPERSLTIDMLCRGWIVWKEGDDVVPFIMPLQPSKELAVAAFLKATSKGHGFRPWYGWEQRGYRVIQAELRILED